MNYLAFVHFDILSESVYFKLKKICKKLINSLKRKISGHENFVLTKNTTQIEKLNKK